MILHCSVSSFMFMKTARSSHNEQLLCPTRFCCCGRRHLIEAAAATALLPLNPSTSTAAADSTTMLNKVHPPRPDWYEEFYASVMNKTMKSYEAEIAGYKSQLFGNYLMGKAEKVLEIGIGTGPNLNYYANDTDIQVFGVDPNKKMEKYAQAAAVAAGLPLANFKFVQAVGEAIPLSDASVDAVVGTLVLCSVKDVDMTLQGKQVMSSLYLLRFSDLKNLATFCPVIWVLSLFEVKRVLKPGGIYLFVEHVAAKDGTSLKFWQSVLDPLQQIVADGCHLTRETGKNISEAGFSSVDLSMAFLSNASLISPHVYGTACK